MRKTLLFLGILNDQDLEWMIAHGTPESIPAGSILIQEGQSIDAIYIVLEGAFSVSVESNGGQEIARLFSGEIVGEMSFVDSRPPSATVKAREPSRVLAITRQALNMHLEQAPGFATRFYQSIAVFLADRLRSTTAHLGYSRDQPLVAEEEYEDELDPEILDNVSLAGARFDMMLKRLRSS